MEDRFNKWKAVFQKKDIRLFINGSYFQLDNSNWIETDNLSIVNPMLIMCTLEKKDIVEKLFKGETVEYVLDEDYYMTLGDNTESSYDTRFWGFVAESRIRGKAFVRFWPLNKISLLK